MVTTFICVNKITFEGNFDVVCNKSNHLSIQENGRVIGSVRFEDLKHIYIYEKTKFRPNRSNLLNWYNFKCNQ